MHTAQYLAYYMGKFSIGANFCIFRIQPRCTIYELRKCLPSKYQILNRQSLMCYVDRVMALYQYFQSLLNSTRVELFGNRHAANDGAIIGVVSQARPLPSLHLYTDVMSNLGVGRESIWMRSSSECGLLFASRYNQSINQSIHIQLFSNAGGRWE